jgi:hypothetical protein
MTNPPNRWASGKASGSGLRRRNKTQSRQETNKEEELGCVADLDERSKVLEPLSIREQTRSWLTKYLVVAVTSALLVATCVGMWTGNWKYVSVVWAVASVIVLAIVRFYFKHRKNE